jgi:hypothetical protein
LPCQCDYKTNLIIHGASLADAGACLVDTGRHIHLQVQIIVIMVSRAGSLEVARLRR